MKVLFYWKYIDKASLSFSSLSFTTLVKIKISHNSNINKMIIFIIWLITKYLIRFVKTIKLNL